MFPGLHQLGEASNAVPLARIQMIKVDLIGQAVRLSVQHVHVLYRIGRVDLVVIQRLLLRGTRHGRWGIDR